MYHLTDTIVALATPQGEGAIGVIRLSGKEAFIICDKVFFGKKLSKQASHTAHFGTIRNEQGRVIDEVLATVFINPKSYTGENVVEVSCHGSQYIIEQLLQLFIRQGARMAKPGEFTLRAFLNGKLDLSQAEAVADLIASRSESGHRLAMQQMRGGISKEIQKLRQELIDFAALIELELDFGEEDVEFADRQKLRVLIHKIQQLISTLLETFKLGNAIKEGVTTVIAGRPNAGKSTLLNALLKEERAIVSDIAGTTRDTIEETLNIHGILFRLVDTAGIREATDKIEAIGVKKAVEKARQSSVLLYVFDCMELNPPDVQADLDKLYVEGMKVFLVGNKFDIYCGMHDNPQYHYDQRKLAQSKAENWAAIRDGWKEKGFEEDYVSAQTGMYIDRLKETLYKMVLGDASLQDQTTLSNSRHYEALQKSHESLGEVLQGLDMGVTQDFIAMDIRRALQFLGEITGEISTDDLLDSIFSRFCIGK
jgi:tRNA modification GTPase